MKKKGQFQKIQKKLKNWKWLFSKSKKKKNKRPNWKRHFLKSKKKKAFVTTIGVGVKEVIWKIEMEK